MIGAVRRCHSSGIAAFGQSGQEDPGFFGKALCCIYALLIRYPPIVLSL